MDINGSVALVTGANRGIGAEFVRQLRDRGANRVIAAARRPETITVPGVEAVRLDVTDPAQIAELAGSLDRLDLLVNNAGVALGATLVGGDPALVRAEFETNVFGPLALARALAPALAAAGGGTVVNVLSALSWFAYPGATSYSASKAAAWSITDGLRLELAQQGTSVLGLHMGVVETDMTAGWPGEKLTPSSVVTAALDGVESGAREVLVDDTARQFKASLGHDPAERYAGING